MINGDLYCKNCFKRHFTEKGTYSVFEKEKAAGNNSNGAVKKDDASGSNVTASPSSASIKSSQSSSSLYRSSSSNSVTAKGGIERCSKDECNIFRGILYFKAFPVTWFSISYLTLAPFFSNLALIF